MTDNEEIFIGGYILRWQDEKFWIVNTATGEAGEFSEEKFSKVLDEFWKREF